MSLRKEPLSWVFIGALLIAIGMTAYSVMWPQLQPHLTLRIGDGVFNAKVITSQHDTVRGASDPDQLQVNDAVLYVYGNDGLWSIDMKDRHMSYDVVWLDNSKKVVYIVKNASSESVPTKFVPNERARYIIEMPAGSVDAKAINVDKKAYFDESNIKGITQ